MFKVDVDLDLIYDPPFAAATRGIVVNRTIELPFPPYNGLRVFARDWEKGSEPIGLKLDDVIWDMDRQTFLAVSKSISEDFPIACIPSEIRYWLDAGWKWGSFRNRYAQRVHR